ncbi:MAG TPA: primosomal protein N', partial [Stellaceae bacterium]
MPDCPANSPGANDRENDRESEPESDPPAGLPRVRVMLPLPLPEPLDYLMPEGAAFPEPGSFVRVSLGPRRMIGVVWDRAGEDAGEESGSAVPLERLKPVGEILPTPALRPELRRFVERVARYTLSPPGAVLRMAMSVEEALLAPPPRRICAATPAGLAALGESPTGGKKLTPARRRVLEALRDGAAYSIAEAARRAGCGAAVVRGLMAAGHVAELLLPGEPPSPPAITWDAA